MDLLIAPIRFGKMKDSKVSSKEQEPIFSEVLPEQEPLLVTRNSKSYYWVLKKNELKYL